MQDNKPCDGKELICINVDKVYDWIVKEKSFDVSFLNKEIAFTPEPTLDADVDNATFTCEVTPAEYYPIVILGRKDLPFCIDGKNVCLQQLNIKKNFILKIFMCLPNGSLLTSEDIPFSRCEQVTLCAPEGTDVEVTYTNLDCFVCTTGEITVDEDLLIEFSELTVSVATCQSIQSTFPVTVEFLADFCEPREDLPTACPTPSRPKQCPSIFPDDGHGHGHGHGHRHCCN